MHLIFPRSPRLLCSAVALVLLLGNWPALAKVGMSGGPRSGQTQTPDASGDLQVTIGLGGMWKIGHVTPVRVRVPSSLVSRVTAIHVATVDGDGVPIIYQQQPNWIDDQASAQAGDRAASKSIWCEATLGRSDRALTVTLLDADDKVVAREQLEADQLGQALPTSQPWIIALGSPLGVDATSYTDTNTGLPNFSTAVLTTADQVPPDWRGLDGCDVLIISTSLAAANAKPTSVAQATSTTAPAQSQSLKVPMVSQLSERQWRALGEWIGQGGLAVLSLGDYAKQLTSSHPLTALLPGTVQDTLDSVRTSSLEAATATNVQLAAISATRLKDVRGVVELTMIDNSGKRFPWWIRYSHGKGVVHLIASDLDQPVLLAWKDRRAIWEKLLSSFWSRGQRIEVQDTNRNVSGSTYLGYDDLIGQLRATLDFFPSARVFGFGVVTAILSVLLLIIGPLDYWISVRLLQRPHFSWFLTGSALLVTCIALVWLEDVSRPKQLLLNSAQIVDYLPEQKVMMVDSWTHIYSSRARTMDVSLKLKQPSSDARLDWQGLPGKGLGGMESNLLADQGMPSYRVHLVPPPGEQSADHPTSTSTAALTSTSNDATASMSAVGIPSSGTKCLFATWTSPFEPTAGTSQLREIKGIDQIQGTLVNPLDVDLLRPVLLYHNWAYSLPSRLRAGEELTVSYDMVPKDLLRRLNRRQIVNNNDQITRWNPEDRQSIDRLLELMMFYKAGGGADYAKLKHRFQPRIDISPLLALDHAVLLGELAEPVGELSLTGIREDQVKREVSSTWCRVLLPVARPEE